MDSEVKIELKNFLFNNIITIEYMITVTSSYGVTDTVFVKKSKDIPKTVAAMLRAVYR